MTEHTQIPWSEEAEKGVLSSMMVSPDMAIPEAIKSLTPSHFHIPAHKAIYNLLSELWSDGKPVDLVNFTQTLRDRNTILDVGGAAYITDVYTFVPTGHLIQYYINTVRDKYVLREIISASRDTVSRALEEQDDVAGVLTDAQERLFKISEPIRSTDLNFGEMISGAIENIESSKEGITGLTTGLVDLDRKTGGFRDGQFIVATGKTGEGKTALGLNIIQHLAMEKNIPCGIISLEMTGEELAERFIASVSRVNLHNIMLNNATTEELTKVMDAASSLKSLPIYIKEDSDIELGTIRAMARQLSMQHKIKFLLVDYVQQISSSIKENRARELALVSQGLKQCAKELGITVMALSQVNDEGNIFDSRAIGFDADKIIRISHGTDSSWMEVSKNRKGPTGLVKVVFIRDIAKFESAART